MLIDLDRLRHCLGPVAHRLDVDALDSCASTSSLLLERTAGGAASGSVIVVDAQTAGRGRRGRVWLSAPEASLTFSLLWRFDSQTPLAGLSLAVGVAVARALASLGVAGVGLKWPNDILRREGGKGTGSWGKLAGVLIELSSDRRGVAAVIGVGINLAAPPDSAALDFPATGLAMAGAAPPERHVLLAALLSELVAVLDVFAGAGFAAFSEEWSRCHAFAGETVRVLEEQREVVLGVCRGADLDGALLVETRDGMMRCLSGDVSLRLA